MVEKQGGDLLFRGTYRKRIKQGLQSGPLRKPSFLALAISLLLHPASPAVMGAGNWNSKSSQATERGSQSEENRKQSELTGGSQQTAFELRDGFLIVVEGRIASLSHRKFILDTGSTHSMIDSRIASQLGLPKKRGAVLNFDHYARIDWTNVPEVQFGPIDARNVRMMVGPLEQFSQFANGIDAVVGLDLLGQTRKLEIDFQARQLTFGELKDIHCAIEAAPRALTVLLEVQGTRLRLILDTGMGEMVVFSDRLHAHAPHLKLLDEERAHEARIPGRIATLSGIQLIPDAHAPVFLLDRAPQSLPEDIDGFLGLKPLLVDFAEIDFGSETLTLRRQDMGPIMLASDSKTSKRISEQENPEEHNYPFR